MTNGVEADRLLKAYAPEGDAPWLRWGPYLSERQWGTVREDYSAGGAAWDYFPHEQARSRAYRWGEDGLAGISDDEQRLCFAVALWNGQDPILKERLFGLTNSEGNHGEDVKEYYFYLDNTPTHSYQRWLYKYPQAPFPYDALVAENARRKSSDGHASEYELLDTGVFDENRYFDVEVEYAKAGPEDILIRITVTNRGPDAADLQVLPTLWFRNTWSWLVDSDRPALHGGGKVGTAKGVATVHADYGPAVERPAMTLHCLAADALYFVENETNSQRLWGTAGPDYPKDGINDHVVSGADTVNPAGVGTKAAAQYGMRLKPGQSKQFRLRLRDSAQSGGAFGADFDRHFEARTREADEFYASLGPTGMSEDQQAIQRQAYAGMLWSKQYYHYIVRDWLEGDPAGPAPPPDRGRNREWIHFHADHILSMPDKWEYPWFAAWDLCFQSVVFARLDVTFAKQQLLILAREFFMSPNGAVPAYEWSFSDVNPPLHAWAALRIFEMEKEISGGEGDVEFLAEIFRYCLMYFTWWTNRKDPSDHNLFEGGFLGLDNIAVVDRSHLDDLESSIGRQVELYQSDGTSWMGMFSLHLMQMAMTLATNGELEYDRLASKFFQHFVFIADAMNSIERRAGGQAAVWDDADGFFYDVLHVGGSSEQFISLRLRSLVGIIALFPVASVDLGELERSTSQEVGARMDWFSQRHSDLLAQAVTKHSSSEEKHLLSFVNPDQLRRVLARVFDETEFLSPHGIRGISRVYLDNPFEVSVDGVVLSEQYEPAESAIGLFGGNSNWRGPVWFPVNFLLIESLRRYHDFFGDDFTVEYPTNSGDQRSLGAVADDLAARLISIFERKKDGSRPVYGGSSIFQEDPHWRDHLLFYEYFHGDIGAGIGASHQTGWTGLVAELLQQSPPS